MAKRIAIQLFGHVRTFELAAPHFFNNVVGPHIADEYDVDIFIHTWNEIEHNTKNKRIDGTKKVDISKTDEAKLCRIYNAKAILIESQLPIDEKIISEKLNRNKRSIKGIYNNAYTAYKTGTLRSEYEDKIKAKYDWVIQTRPDVLFLSPFCIDDFFRKHTELNIDLDPQALYFAHNIFNGGAIKSADPHLLAGTDVIYFATPGIMDRATSLFCNFDTNFDENDFWTMEIWWMQFWKKSGLHPIAIDYKFRRDWLVLYEEMIPQLPKILCNHNKKQHGETMDNMYIKLFGFIPLLKIKRKKNGYKVYLFNFIPFIKIKGIEHK
jgi:hypothetical protein